MAIDTFDKLVQEIIDYSHRGDLDLKIPTFIEIAEVAMLANPDEILKVRGQEVRSLANTDGQYLALPDDFQAARGLRIVTGENNSINLGYRAPSDIRYRTGTGQPNTFTVTSQIEFDIVPDTVYSVEIHYYKDPAPLTSDNQTNEVLTRFPTIYLFGGLWQAFEFSLDTENSQKYRQLFIAAIKGANKKDKQGRYGPAPSMRPAGTVV